MAMEPSDCSYLRKNEGGKWANKMAAIPVRLPTLPDDLKDSLESLDIDVASTYDFDDGAWKGRAAIVLKRLPAEQVVELGRELLSNLTRGISQRHVGSIFQIAFNLKKPGEGLTQHLLPEVDELRETTDVELQVLHNIVSEEFGDATDPIEKGSLQQLSQAYSFIAASMLKMFTMSPENYVKSWVHIPNEYKRFHSYPMPILGIVPNAGVIKRIHDHFSITDFMKSTLYRLLYSANRNGDITSIHRYLYDNHLSHNGMHIFPITYKICIDMNVTPKDLLSAIYTGRFHLQTKGLIAAFKLMQNTDDNHRRKMWKYGRIFDYRFFASLQTKTCAKMCYQLACVLQRISPIANAGILEIRQFDKICEEDKDRLMEESKVIVKALNMIPKATEEESLKSMAF